MPQDDTHDSSKDKEPGAMEFFILALIEKVGLTSLYAFRERAGLQPGGIRFSLDRLEGWGWISRAEMGRRRRRDLALTTAGREVLERSWADCLQDYADGESILRSAFVAWVMAGTECSADYLKRTGESRRGKAEEAKLEAEHRDQSQKDPLSAYGWMRVLSEAHRREAESQAFLSISQSLGVRSKTDAQQQQNSAEPSRK
jgi:DNA-binding MarR family transcriptional regulator